MASMDHSHRGSPRHSQGSHHRVTSSPGSVMNGGAQPKSRVSRTVHHDAHGGSTPKDTPHIASEFLRCALERERASRSLSFEPSDRYSSPIDRAATADPNRRRSRVEPQPETLRHSPMGAKEASETISKLHNENFNLKLEVYHRRQREVSLQEKVEKLENDLAQRDDIESELRAELDAKDDEIKTQTAAVQEAVNVIMDLETKLAALKQSPQPAAARAYQDQDELALEEQEDDDPDEYHGPSTPTPHSRGQSRLDDDIATLARMPSFVSDFSTNTMNLRRVYLSSHGSALNLHHGFDPSDKRSYTPSLRILNEVYTDMSSPIGEFPPCERATPQPQEPSLSSRKSKEEKRLAIEKVLETTPQPHRRNRSRARRSLKVVATDAHIDKDALPPTPDTMTTSSTSDPRPGLRGNTQPPGGKQSLSPAYASPSRKAERGADSSGSQSRMSVVAPSVTAFNGRKDIAEAVLPRPRSASDVTGSTRWDVSDTESLESDMDIWLRERGRPSPDLFSVPTSNPSWDYEQLVGGLTDERQNTLRSIRDPPPPDRRSSLQAVQRPMTRGTPSIVRHQRSRDRASRCMDLGATPPPIQLNREQQLTGASLMHSSHGSQAMPLRTNGSKGSVREPLRSHPTFAIPPSGSTSSSIPRARASSFGPASAAGGVGVRRLSAVPTIPKHMDTQVQSAPKKRWFGFGRLSALRNG